MRASRKQWDLLARGWELCERGGFSPAHLKPFAKEIRGPCLVVGSGHGLIVSAARDLGVAPVHSVDHSPEMVKEARRRRRVQSLVADAAEFPFEPASYRSLICTTGVLDPGDAQQSRRVFEEFSRVLAPGSILLLGVFQGSENPRAPAVQLGLLERGSQRQDRIVALWRSKNHAVEQRALVAKWTGCSAWEGAARLAQHSTMVAHWNRALDDLTVKLGSAEAVRAGLAWTLPGLCPGQVWPDLSKLPFEMVETQNDPTASTHLFALRRTS